MGPDRARSIVGLVTDFGTRDPYAAAVKAVIAARCAATLIDLTHEIAPGDLFEAAWFLRSIAPFLPGAGEAEATEGRTLCVTVVDPGVGSDRRIVAARSLGVVHVAPDNGVLTFVVDDRAAVFSVENERLFLPSDSTTFHGRDRFAPVAAALAGGMAFELLGPRIDGRGLIRLPFEEAVYTTGSASGQIIRVDRFGNVITDIDAKRCRSRGMPLAVADSLEVTAHLRGGREARWSMRVQHNYEPMRDRPEPFVIIGSDGTVEISVPGSSAAEVLQMARFDRIELVASP
jgi:S-adenosyl-L-methionine hydrolase (adenosine-forming)